jgi:hypothetical protein
MDVNVNYSSNIENDITEMFARPLLASPSPLDYREPS